MTIRTEISDVRGVLVVARAEGAILGSVSHIFIEPRTSTISALSFKKRLGGKESIVEQQHVEIIGRDVVLISREGAARPLSPETRAGMRSLKELQGTWVSTVDGQQLGTLVDLDVDETTWTVTELRLADGKLLPIADTAHLTIGPDQIMVPSDHAAKVVHPDKNGAHGFLGRVFGGESIDELKQTISRTVRGVAGSKEPDPHKDTAPASKDANRPKERSTGSVKSRREARPSP